MTTGSCGSIYDQIDGTLAYDTLQHTFPTGSPTPSVGITNSGAGAITEFVTGYLIDASAQPPNAAAQISGRAKALSLSR